MQTCCNRGCAGVFGNVLICHFGCMHLCLGGDRATVSPLELRSNLLLYLYNVKHITHLCTFKMTDKCSVLIVGLHRQGVALL